MADVKISGLPASNTPLAGTEVLPIVQSSTTKKVSVDNLTAGKNVPAKSMSLDVSPSPWWTSSRAIDSTGILAASGATGFLATGNVYINAAGANFIYKTSSVAATSYYQSVGNHSWSDAPAGTAGNAATMTQRMLLSNGNLTLNTGNLIIGTDGKGIDFSATPGTGTSELFDDYEEGTFTPTIIGTTTAGTGTYSVQVGRYTKIGNRVAYNIYLSWSAHDGTGNMQIAALPFTSANVTNGLNTQTLWANSLTLTALNYLQAYINPNTAGIVLQQYPVGGGSASNVPIDTSAAIMVSGTYEV